jgi:hypothetical protein
VNEVGLAASRESASRRSRIILLSPDLASSEISATDPAVSDPRTPEMRTW